jgi:hypothetical protein
MLLRSPCKNLKPYDNPFLGFEKGIKKKEEEFPLAPMVPTRRR